MTNIKDRLPQSSDSNNPTGTAKANYTATAYGNDKGSIAFGHIHEKGDVTAGVILRTPDGKHFIALDIDDQRKGYTTCAGPGNFTIEAGSANEAVATTIMINAKKGDICLTATNGNLRLEGNNIELVARGEGGSAGNIRCTATESFVIEDTKKVLIDAKKMFKLSTCDTGQVIANGTLSIYGSIIKGVTDACSVKPSKNSNQNFQKKCTQGV